MLCSPRRRLHRLHRLRCLSAVALAFAASASAGRAAPPAAPTAAKPTGQPNPAALYALVSADSAKISDAEDAYRRGVDALSKGQTKRGGAAFTRALALRPDFTDANFERGLCSEELGEWQAAITDFTTVLRAKPRLYDAYIERGRAYGKLNNAARARADWAQAKTLRPDRREAYVLMGEPVPTSSASATLPAASTTNAVDSPSPSAGSAGTNAAVAPPTTVASATSAPPIVMPTRFAPFAAEFRNADDADELYSTGVDALNDNHYERAGAALTRALQLRRKFTDAQFSRGLCFEWLQDWKSAITDFSAVVLARPKFYDGYVERARSYYMSGDLHRARADVNAAIALKPARDDAYQIFGDKNPTKK